MKKQNKKATIGTTTTWVVATIIIFFLMIIFIYISFTWGNAEGLFEGSNKLEPNRGFSEYHSTLSEQMLLALLKTDFKGKLLKDIIEEGSDETKGENFKPIKKDVNYILEHVKILNDEYENYGWSLFITYNAVDFKDKFFANTPYSFGKPKIFDLIIPNRASANNQQSSRDCSLVYLKNSEVKLCQLD